MICLNHWVGFPSGSGGKESACNAGDPGLVPELGRSPWEEQWQPAPVFLPGKPHGQRSLVGYSSWGHKASDITEPLTLSRFEPLNEPTLGLLFLWVMLCQILYLTDAYTYEHSNTRRLISVDFIACTWSHTHRHRPLKSKWPEDRGFVCLTHEELASLPLSHPGHWHIAAHI